MGLWAVASTRVRPGPLLSRWAAAVLGVTGSRSCPAEQCMARASHGIFTARRDVLLSLLHRPGHRHEVTRPGCRVTFRASYSGTQDLDSLYCLVSESGIRSLRLDFHVGSYYTHISSSARTRSSFATSNPQIHVPAGHS